MAVQFLTNITEQEFKVFLKEALLEILGGQTQLKEQPQELMNIQQTAEFLNLKVNTLYEKTCRKTIPHLKKGNKLYFQRSTLERWINEGKVKTNDEIEREALTFRLNRKVA